MAVVIDNFEGSPSTVEFEDMSEPQLQQWALIRIEALEVLLRRQLDAGKRHLSSHDEKSHGRRKGMRLATELDRKEFKAKTGKAIPPAWTDLHVAENLDTATVLALGRDAKGRVQSVYSSVHTEHQAEVKFARNKELAKNTDKLDHAIDRDAMTNDDAAALMLIRKLGMRPGSTKDTGAKVQAYGATTLQARHVRLLAGDKTVLAFTGKKGVKIRLQVKDPKLAALLRARLGDKSGTDPLFDTNENKVRDYMRSTGVPPEFLLKDLRTLHANTVALKALQGRPVAKTQTEFNRERKRVADLVSAELGNSPAMALSSYINPTVFTALSPDGAFLR